MPCTNRAATSTHLALRQAAQRRRAGEQRDPGEEDAPAAEQVTEAPGEQQ